MYSVVFKGKKTTKMFPNSGHQFLTKVQHWIVLCHCLCLLSHSQALVLLLFLKTPYGFELWYCCASKPRFSFWIAIGLVLASELEIKVIYHKQQFVTKQNLKYWKCFFHTCFFGFVLILLQRSFKTCLQISSHILTAVILMWKAVGKNTLCIKHVFSSASFTSLLMFNNCNLSSPFGFVLSDYKYSRLPAFKMNFINEGVFFRKWYRLCRIWVETAALHDQFNSHIFFLAE